MRKLIYNYVSNIQVYLTSNQKARNAGDVILINLSVALLLSTLLIILNSLIRKKIIQEREKPSPFECGFDPKRRARLPFSLRFYLIAVIFLIFDVEITLIIPIPLVIGKINPWTMVFLSIGFIIILLLGLYHEWNEGALNWDN